MTNLPQNGNSNEIVTHISLYIYAFAYADITKNCLKSEAVSFSDQFIAPTVSQITN